MSLLSRLDWDTWEQIIVHSGVTIDRPIGSVHPNHPKIIYPIDYGFVNDTVSTDGEEVDIFVGTSDSGLVGAIATTDFRKNDQELKLIYNCSRTEIYLINGFINFDKQLMSGDLILRRSFREIE